MIQMNYGTPPTSASAERVRLVVYGEGLDPRLAAWAYPACVHGAGVDAEDEDVFWTPVCFNDGAERLAEAERACDRAHVPFQGLPE